MKRLMIKLVLLSVIALSVSGGSAFTAETSLPEIPVRDTVTMVEFGADTCIPCKLMKPILEELEDEYAGRASILTIDVTDGLSLARKFGVLSIPTQIFFDSRGEEAHRHAGFYPKQDIRKWLDQLLEKQEP